MSSVLMIMNPGVASTYHDFRVRYGKRVADRYLKVAEKPVGERSPQPYNGEDLTDIELPEDPAWIPELKTVCSAIGWETAARMLEVNSKSLRNWLCERKGHTTNRTKTAKRAWVRYQDLRTRMVAIASQN